MKKLLLSLTMGAAFLVGGSSECMLTDHEEAERITRAFTGHAEPNLAGLPQGAPRTARRSAFLGHRVGRAEAEAEAQQFGDFLASYSGLLPKFHELSVADNLRAFHNANLAAVAAFSRDHDLNAFLKAEFAALDAFKDYDNSAFSGGNKLEDEVFAKNDEWKTRNVGGKIVANILVFDEFLGYGIALREAAADGYRKDVGDNEGHVKDLAVAYLRKLCEIVNGDRAGTTAAELREKLPALIEFLVTLHDMMDRPGEYKR
jgi:hypothetical protein